MRVKGRGAGRGRRLPPQCVTAGRQAAAEQAADVALQLLVRRRVVRRADVRRVGADARHVERQVEAADARAGLLVGRDRAVDLGRQLVHEVVGLADVDVDRRALDVLLQLGDAALQARRRDGRAGRADAAHGARQALDQGRDVDGAGDVVRLHAADVLGAVELRVLDDRAGLAERGDDLLGVDLARATRGGRAGATARRRQRVGRQRVPLAVQLQPRLVADLSHVAVEGQRTGGDGERQVGLLGGAVGRAVDRQRHGLRQERRHRRVLRVAVDADLQVHRDLLRPGRRRVGADRVQDRLGAAVAGGGGRHRRRRRVVLLAAAASAGHQRQRERRPDHGLPDLHVGQSLPSVPRDISLLPGYGGLAELQCPAREVGRPADVDEA